MAGRRPRRSVGDLEVVPRKRIEYRGVVLEEMDVEAVVARRPEVALVDELAHTNVPGVTHGKRWEDVMQLIDNGINVMSAVNVQHLESLNDVVAKTLGITVRETVPDWVLGIADQVVNIDISAEDLRQRLTEGKIYRAEKVQAALENFFTEENLTTLRELALREVASSVDRAREGIVRRRRGRPSYPRPSIGSSSRSRAIRRTRPCCSAKRAASREGSTPTGIACTSKRRRRVPSASTRRCSGSWWTTSSLRSPWARRSSSSWASISPPSCGGLRESEA